MKKIILSATIATIFALAANAQTEKCGTAEMLEQWQTEEHSSRSMWAMPVLTGVEQIYNTAHFEIHYTLTGTDAISGLDADGNFVPDFVDTVAAAAETSYTNYTARGYIAPPGAAIGNTLLYDIYLLDIPIHYTVNWYGATLPFDSIGDSPFTVEPETHSATSFLVLRNEYTIFSPSTNPSIDIEVTVAHEYSHSVDFGYSYFISSWFTEARATFEESNVYPQHIDNYGYISQVLDDGDLALNLDRLDNGGNIHPHEYGGWLFNKFLAEHVAPEVLKPVLENARLKAKAWAAIDAQALNHALIYNHETTLREQFDKYCIANYFLTSDSAYAPYVYAAGTDYKTYVGHPALTENTFNYSGPDIFWNSATDGNGILQRLGVDYFRINATEKFSVRLETEGKDSSFRLILLKIRTADKHFEFCPAGFQNDSTFASNVLDLTGFDKIIALVIRYDIYDTVLNSKQYILSIEEPVQFLNWWIPNTSFSSATTTLVVDKNNVLWTNAGLSDYLYFQSGGGPYLAKGVTSFNGYFWHHHHYFNSTRAPGTNGMPGTTMDIDVAPDNHIWFGDANSGLYEYDHAIWKHYDDGDNNPGTAYGAFQVDAQTSNVWCAPRGSYLYELVGGVPTQQGSYTGNTMFVKFIGGKKYVGTNSHLYVEDGGGTTVYDTSSGLPNGYLTDAEVDHSGNLWVATYGGGLGMFNGTTWQTFDPWNPSGAYVATRVMDIAVDANGVVWLAYQNDGFGRYKNGTFIKYNEITAPLFPAEAVYSIDFDKSNGCLWMATDHGIIYYCDTADIAAPAALSEVENNFIELKLFPNPANDVVSIYADGNLFAENCEVKIYGISGQLVKSLINNLSTNILKMNVSDLMSGVYFVEIKNARTKFVKM